MTDVFKIDPICGMEGHIPKHGHFFCSEHCIEVYEKQKPITVEKSHWKKNVLIAFGVIVTGLLIYYLHQSSYMLPFMGMVFILISILKLLDLKGFAIAFARYDILAKRSHFYAYSYPFIELILGFMYLFGWWVYGAAWITLGIMSIGIVGVTKNLMSKNPIRCACLGTLIKLPLTKFTFFEDLFMIVMALLILY